MRTDSMQRASLRRTRHEQGQPARAKGVPHARSGCRTDGMTSTARALAFKSAAARLAPQLGCERVGGGTVHLDSRNPEETQCGEAVYVVGVKIGRGTREKHLKPRRNEMAGGDGVADGLVQE